jgi:pimeloyl-ACP methyl ester carboxylesterase
VAAALGVAAVANHLVARAMERRHPPRGRFVEVDGVRLHYLDEGHGPVVVLLHGNGAMAQDFAISDVMRLLARGHRVLAFDRPGFGHSTRPHGRFWSAEAQADLIQRALAKLGIGPAVILGHSWASLVALSIALNHPERVSGLVLLSGYYRPSLRGDVVPFSLAAIPVLGDILRYTLSPPLGWLIHHRAFRNLFAPSPVPARFEAEFPVGLSLRPSQLKATAADTALMIPAAARHAPRYRELSLPVTILAGRGDRMVDFERQARWLHRRIPHSRLEAVEGGGHMLHHIEPRRVAAAIEGVARQSLAA